MTIQSLPRISRVPQLSFKLAQRKATSERDKKMIAVNQPQNLEKARDADQCWCWIEINSNLLYVLFKKVLRGLCLIEGVSHDCILSNYTIKQMGKNTRGIQWQLEYLVHCIVPTAVLWWTNIMMHFDREPQNGQGWETGAYKSLRNQALDREPKGLVGWNISALRQQPVGIW